MAKGKEILLTLAAALTGVWIGCQARQQVTGRPAQALMFDYEEENGRHYRNIPVGTKLYPALLFSMLGRPRWLFALLGGLLTGALVDDRHEARWLGWIVRHAPGVPQKDKG